MKNNYAEKSHTLTWGNKLIAKGSVIAIVDDNVEIWSGT